MNDSQKKWSDQYVKSSQKPVYPTEWVIRMIAGANYPNYKHDKTKYNGKTIVDLSCGDGRNLQLLLNLGFKVYATETESSTIDFLRKRFPDVTFEKGMNHECPYSDNTFDYALSCGAFYYLADGTNFTDNMVELNRILKPKGVFFCNMTRKETFILDGATKLDGGEYLIRKDPHNFRNGQRWKVVETEEQLIKLFSPYFNLLAIGGMFDDFWGYIRSHFAIVCENIK